MAAGGNPSTFTLAAVGPTSAMLPVGGRAAWGGRASPRGAQRGGNRGDGRCQMREGSWEGGGGVPVGWAVSGDLTVENPKVLWFY